MQTKTYTAWCNMKARCSNKKRKDYKNYGGRGISVCEKWQNFSGFLSDMGEKPEGMTLERKDVDGNYEPSNCVWTTTQDQNNNRRDTVRVTLNNCEMSVKQASDLLGIPYERVRWAVERYGNDWLGYAKSDSAGKIQSNNTSGYRGVSFHKASGRYHARIQIDGKIKSVGYFGTAEEAALARAAEIGRTM